MKCQCKHCKWLCLTFRQCETRGIHCPGIHDLRSAPTHPRGWIFWCSMGHFPTIPVEYSRYELIFVFILFQSRVFCGFFLNNIPFSLIAFFVHLFGEVFLGGLNCMYSVINQHVYIPVIYTLYFYLQVWFQFVFDFGIFAYHIHLY